MITALALTTLAMLADPQRIVPAPAEPAVASGDSEPTVAKTPECTMFATRDLYVGARDQKISVQKNGAECDGLGIEAGPKKYFTLVGKTATGTAEIVVTLQKGDESSWLLTPTNDALVATRGSWTVFEHGEKSNPKGTLALDIEQLDVDFEIQANYTSSLLQTLLETHKIAEHTLVVDASRGREITNILHPKLPASFPTTAPAGRKWFVESKSSHVSICGASKGKNGTEDEKCDAKFVWVESLRQVELATGIGAETPAIVEFSLQLEEEHDGSAKPTKTPLLRFSAEVAKKTAAHELPLPLEQIAYVTCPTRRGRQAKVRAERGGGTLDAAPESIKDGECKLLLSEDLLLLALADRHKRIKADSVAIGFNGAEIDPEREDVLKSGEAQKNYCEENEKKYHVGETCAHVLEPRGGTEEKAREKALAIAALYGPQSGFVCVRPETSTDGSGVLCSPLDYDPRVKPQRRHEIPLPIDGSKLLDPSTTYDVSIVRAANEEEAKKAEGVLVARLRSRGAFGMRSLRNGGAVRFFLTTPINVAALQFPASVHDLRTSDDTRRMQISGIDLGVKLGIEPWNYRHAKNPWTLNPVFVPAALFFRNFGTAAADRTRSRAIIASGVEVRLPLIEGTNQTDTAFALGVFHGYDLRHGESQLLLTLGIDILSVFGAASDKK